MCAMQGWRVDMEDAHSMVLDVEGNADASWFAVYDGHGGGYTSKYAAAKVLSYVTATPEWKADPVSPESISAALVRGFLQTDADLRAEPDIAGGDDHSGSTAITAFITKDHIIVGNCGDSRAMLVRDNAAVELSVDHKPYNEAEQRRIEAAGGTVTMRRVNGDLAVSRALGDFTYKHAAHLPATQQQVSPEPEVHVEVRTSKDQFVVLACDGIWDVMTNEEVAAFVLEKTREGVDDLRELAGELIDECLHKGSRDNMSAVIVALPGAPRPTAAEVEARKARLAAAPPPQGSSNGEDDGMGSYGGAPAAVPGGGPFADPLDTPTVPAGISLGAPPAQ